MKNPKCILCTHRASIPGDAHSECKHPTVANGPLSVLVALAGVGSEANALNIKANSYGIKMGWFMWPLNFDPTWLENCDGYKEKK